MCRIRNPEILSRVLFVLPSLLMFLTIPTPTAIFIPWALTHACPLLVNLCLISGAVLLDPPDKIQVSRLFQM